MFRWIFQTILKYKKGKVESETKEAKLWLKIKSIIDNALYLVLVCK